MQGLTIKTSKSKSSQQQIETYVTSKRSEREFRGLSKMGSIMTQLTQQNDQVEDAWDLRGNNNTPNIKKAKERRKQAYQRYKVQKHISSSIEAKNFIFLNQGDQAGACSFMALMNMYQVAGYANTLPWFQKLKKPTGVRSVYIDMLHLSDDGYSTYQAMAGMGLQNRTFCPDISWNHLLSHFKYEVFRGGYGQRWNNSIQGLASTHGEYDENVQNWLDNKLQDGCIIAVPFMQHFCCIIGHDENHFLFLNSYGVLHDQGGLSPMLMYTKRQVASVINDCFYWTPGAVTTSTTTKKTTAKKTTAKKTTAKKTTTNKTTSRKHPKKTTAKKTTTKKTTSRKHPKKTTAYGDILISDDDILNTDRCPECSISLFKQFYTTF
jgi:hypothetical protein